MIETILISSWKYLARSQGTRTQPWDTGVSGTPSPTTQGQRSHILTEMLVSGKYSPARGTSGGALSYATTSPYIHGMPQRLVAAYIHGVPGSVVAAYIHGIARPPHDGADRPRATKAA